MYKIWQIIPVTGTAYQQKRATRRSPEFELYMDSTVCFILVVIVIATISETRYKTPYTL
jgi:hypothetical protein